MEPGLGVVSRPGETRHLPPQQMDLLAYLAARPGQLVPKEELLNAVWKGAVVEEIALPRCVSEIRKVLGDDAKAPRYVETVPKRGYRLLTSTVRPAQETPTPSPTPNLRRRPRLLARWALVVTLVFAAALLAWVWRGVRAVSLRAAQPEPPAVISQRSLAILGFTDRSRDEGMVWLETALPDLLASELALAPEVRVIPPELVAHLLAELTPIGASSPSRVFLERAGKTLGADLLAWGAYSMVAGEAGGEIRIDITVQAAGEQKPLLVLSQDGPSRQALELAALLGARLRERLGAGTAPDLDHQTQSALPVRSPLAIRQYYEGLRRLRRFEAEEAKRLLERALSEEPQQPLAQLALSQAWVALGNRAKAAEHARQALALAAKLRREERLHIEAQSLTTLGRWDTAVEVYRALWQRSPGNLELGLQLGRTQLGAALAQEARQTVAEIERRAGPGYLDPRLDLLAADAALAVADHEHALSASRRATRLGAELGADLVVSHARLAESRALHALGRVQEARVTLEAAALAFSVMGDRRNEAWARLRLAGWAHESGDFHLAGEVYRQSLTAFRECGDAGGEAEAQLRLASLALDLDDLTAAEGLARAALGLSREIGERGQEAEALARLGYHEAMQSRWTQATALLEEALVIRRQAGDSRLVSETLTELGMVAWLRADFAAAQMRLREAAVLARRHGLRGQLALAMFFRSYLDVEAGELGAAEAGLAEAQALFEQLENQRMIGASLQVSGEIRLMRGDLAGARERLEAALASRLALGESLRIANTRTALAELLLEAGDIQGALSLARQAAAVTNVARDPAIKSKIKLADVLLAAGQLEAALRVVEEFGITVSPAVPDSIAAYWRGTVAAAAWTAAGESDRARAHLSVLVGEAERRGLWRAGAEASLALAAIELANGAREVALTRLAALETDARQRGYLLLANKAQALVAGGGVKGEDLLGILRRPLEDPRPRHQAAVATP